MPNHVTNIIKAPANVIDALKKAGEVVDFNAIIPIPYELQNTVDDGSNILLAEILAGDWNRWTAGGSVDADGSLVELRKELTKRGIIAFHDDEAIKRFVQLLDIFRAHGTLTCNEWALRHWGTKWNAYWSHKIVGGVKFDTAWSAPYPVIDKLAALFPEEKIEHSWADEDGGSNVGRCVYQFGNARELPWKRHRISH